MIKKLSRRLPLSKILLICFVIFTADISNFAQSKVDLNVTARSISETAHGGEKFSYSITVSNIGSAKATDVKLVSEPEKNVTLIGNSISKGTCRFAKDSYKANLYCSIGDIDVGETVLIAVEAKIDDFGGEPAIVSSDTTSNAQIIALLNLMKKSDTQKKNNPLGTLAADVDVSAEEFEDDRENNRSKVFVQLVPSKNLPPRIEIVSPKRETAFTKPLNKPIEIPIVIKAFDLDGKIDRVIVSDVDSPQFVFEDNRYKYIINGKKYTKEELEEGYKNEEFVKSLEVRAVSTGKKTYIYTAKNFVYGSNRISVSAFDDGGRSASQDVEFTINRDATVEIVSPRENRLFTPNSTIIVETVSKINDSTLSQLRISGTRAGYFYPDSASIPLLRQTSKIGNIYKHQYVWKNVEEGIYQLNVMLLDGETPTLKSKDKTIFVVEPRIIKIFSLMNGQEFEEGEPVKVSIDATDAKGRVVVEDEFELIVNGKHKATIYNAWKNAPAPLYEMVLDKDYGYEFSNLEKGIHTIQVIAKRTHYGDVKLGESAIITIKVK